MTCCQPTIFPFNEAITTINYFPYLASLYGSKPNTQIYYREATEYVLSDDMSGVSFDGVNIVADHGGVQVGLLKVF